MCGIAGLISRNGLPIDRHDLNVMTSLVSHRGPDGEGHFLNGMVALGNRRLSILDLSKGSSQPMICPYTRRVITFNGEVYNFVELRHELKRNGYVFRSNSDTEVILTAYDHWGSSCGSHFNGMWAFAIYDPEANKIFCSRDRFGVKPFYYVVTDEFFAFGSEIRQLLKFIPHIKANVEVLVDYLFSGAMEYGSATFFAGVKQLLPGHNLQYRIASHQFNIERFYELKRRNDLDGISMQDSIAMWRECLHDAVKLRLRSDVAVGTCLSGGLDSSSVATIASGLYTRMNGTHFAAITAVSEDPSNDESEHARSVVDRAGLRWMTIRPSYEDFASTIDDVALAQEEPFGSPSICMQYFVMREARKNGLLVLLDGQGGDETMLGYERYFAAHFRNAWAINGFVRMIREMMAAIRHNAKMRPRSALSYLLYFSNAHFRYWNYLARNSYLTQRPAMPSHIVRYAEASQNILELQKLEIEQYSLPHLLRYGDKNSMRHGVETRLPFLNYRHVELALSLPWSAKITNGWTKYLLRKAMNDVLPESIVWRRDKRGFEAPSRIWLDRHKEIMRDAVLSSKILCSLADSTKLKQSYRYLECQTQWRLYSVALWERLFHVGLVA